MPFLYVIEEAIQALRSNVLRSLLTIVGIVVGIFSVTMMLALGAGLTSNILNTFNSFITGDITVSGTLTMSDLDWMKSQPYIKAVLASNQSRNVSVTALGSTFAPTVEYAVGDYQTVAHPKLVSGTLFDFTDTKYSEPVAIVDQGFLAAVQTATNQSVASSTITIAGQPFKIIAVVEGGTGGFGRRGDGTIIIPYHSAVGVVTNTTGFTTIAISLADQTYYEIAGKHILETLNTSRASAKDSTDNFAVTTAQDAIKSAQTTTSMLSLFLALIGGIALFVGGIGTMNMMLTTVTERTKEIGLRKAIGAHDRDVLLQILAESVALTLIGGLVGIAFSYAASIVANQFLVASSTAISLQLSFRVVMLATLVSFIVGIVFGIYPARNASKLQPVDALRAD
jgi:putative ABC transport system permease protein